MKFSFALLCTIAAVTSCCWTTTVNAQSATCDDGNKKLCSLLQISNNKLAKQWSVKSEAGVLQDFQSTATIYPDAAGYQGHTVVSEYLKKVAFVGWQSIALKSETAGVIDDDVVWESGLYSWTAAAGANPNSTSSGFGEYWSLWGANNNGKGRSMMSLVGIQADVSKPSVPANIVGKATGATYADGVALVQEIEVGYYLRNITAIQDIYLSDATIVDGNTNHKYVGLNEIAKFYTDSAHGGIASLSLVVDSVQVGKGGYFTIIGHYRAIAGKKGDVDGPTLGLGAFMMVAAREVKTNKFKLLRQMLVPTYHM